MAFRQPTAQRQTVTTSQPAQISSVVPVQQSQVDGSQEWILFAPASRAESSTNRTGTAPTAGLSRVSDFGSLQTTERSGQVNSSVLDEEAEDDAELDSLDEGLHAFQQPAVYTTYSNQSHGPVLPAHDGLGSFQASSSRVLEQLWQHEQFNSKRKHEGHHRSMSSIHRYLETIDEIEAQANEEKRLRIEKWRIEQSQALLEEVERETRRKLRQESTKSLSSRAFDDVSGTTPKQKDFINSAANVTQNVDNEPFWRRITRKFIQDIIGIDEPLLSVILGESLPGEETPRATSPEPQATSASDRSDDNHSADTSWRDRLLQRIARELGVFVHQLTPHPSAFSTYTPQDADYAGISVSPPSQRPSSSSRPTYQAQPTIDSSLGPNFPPTIRDDLHASTWGIEEDSPSMDLQKEREYWERELDLRMVFKYLKDRFSASLGSSSLNAPAPPPQQTTTQPRPIVIQKDDSARRAAIIRQHHPLVGRAHRSPSAARLRRDSRLSGRRASSSCASESVKGSRLGAGLRSGSSRNYWDIGGSGAGSGSLVASGGMMGAW